MKGDVATALIAFAAVAIVWWAIAHQNVQPLVDEDTGNYTGSAQ